MRNVSPLSLKDEERKRSKKGNEEEYLNIEEQFYERGMQIIEK